MSAPRKGWAYAAYQIKAMLAERLLGWAMRLDPTDDRAVSEAYRNLWRVKIAAIERELA